MQMWRAPEETSQGVCVCVCVCVRCVALCIFILTNLLLHVQSEQDTSRVARLQPKRKFMARAQRVSSS